LASTTRPEQRAGRNLALDGLRGIGAIAIVLYHMAPGFERTAQFETVGPYFARYYIFLDLFFIVSGVVLAGSAKIFAARLSQSNLSTFYLDRATRIYPLHWAMLAIAVLLECLFFLQVIGQTVEPGNAPFDRPYRSWETLLTTTLLLQSWGFHDKLTWNIPAWYLSALLFAYLAFPFVMRIAGVLNDAVRAWAIFIVGLIASLGLHYWFSVGWNYGDPSIYRALAEVLLGCGIALLPQWKFGDRSHAVLQIAAAVSVLYFVHSPYFYDYWKMGAFVALLIFIRSDRGPVARALSTRPMQWLGAISFSLYMVHWNVLFSVDSIGGMSLPFIGLLFSPEIMWLNLLARIALIVWLAWLTYRYIETPMARLLGEWRKKQQARAVAAEGANQRS
jgi:peptidoglycan/LPS O-acetylase OafA/YrhL